MAIDLWNSWKFLPSKETYYITISSKLLSKVVNSLYCTIVDIVHSLNIYDFSLVSMVCFHVFVNKDKPTYFINNRILLITTYKETDKLQKRHISLLVAIVTVLVHHLCSVKNQEWVCDMHTSCVTCIYWYKYTCQNCMQQCVYMLDFNVYM